MVLLWYASATKDVNKFVMSVLFCAVLQYFITVDYTINIHKHIKNLCLGNEVMYIALENNLQKGKDKAEQQPYLYHLNQYRNRKMSTT